MYFYVTVLLESPPPPPTKKVISSLWPNSFITMQIFISELFLHGFGRGAKKKMDEKWEQGQK